MPWGAAATVAGAVIGGVSQSNAAKSAAKAQTQSADANIALAQQIRGENLAAIEKYNPYASFAGSGVSDELKNLMGLGENGSAGALSTLQNMPGYQFEFDQGVKARDQSAVFSGMSRSGKHESDLTRFGQDYAGSKYSSRVNELMTLMNNMAGVSGQVTGNNTNYGQQVSTENTNKGTAAANRSLGLGQAWSDGAQNAANAVGIWRGWG